MFRNRTFSTMCFALIAYSNWAVGNDIIVTYPTQTNGPCHIAVSATGVSLDITTGDLTTQGTFGNGCPSTCVGAGCGAPTPSFTQNLVSTPLLPAIGGPFTISWAVTNATECTTDGSVFPTGSLPGWPTSGQICSSASTCATSSISLIGPAAAGAYVFVLTCTNGGVNPVSSRWQMFIEGGGSGTPGITRQISGTVINGGTTRTNVDMTSYPQVFGYDPADDTAGHPFPGIPQDYIGLNLTKNKYFSLRFTVPVKINPDAVGRWSFDSSPFSGASVGWTISSQEGDFGNVNPIATECKRNGGGTESSSIIWSINGNLQGSCALTPSQTYYLNYVNAALATPATSACPTASCAFAVTNKVFVQ